MSYQLGPWDMRLDYDVTLSFAASKWSTQKWQLPDQPSEKFMFLRLCLTFLTVTVTTFIHKFIEQMWSCRAQRLNIATEAISSLTRLLSHINCWKHLLEVQISLYSGQL